jgi:diguanylate cyclase (GGDEF)-like protein/PAS domain S-box-containing protein
MVNLFNQLDYIFFFYGLAFILLAAICQFLKRRSTPGLAWGWLGSFAVLQGSGAGLDLLAYSCGWGNEPLLDSARLILLVASLLALVEFGRASLIAIRGRGPGRWVLAALLGVALLGGPAGFPGLCAASRYALGLVGSLWAAGIFYWASKADAPGDRALLGAAVAMGVFGLTMGLLTDPAPFLPASIFNSEIFRQLPGVPVQLVRGLPAVGICICLALFARASLLSEEMDRRVWQWEVNLLRGAGAGLVILVVVGWFFTQYLGRDALLELRGDQEHQGKVLGQTMSSKMGEIDRLVSAMAGSPAITSWMAARSLQSRQQANSVLDRYSQISAASICYLMDPNGLTIASSNRDLPASFVGKNFGFRPYFQEPMRGASGRYWAVGVVNKELGYYASSPVKDDQGKVIGVAVIKQAINGSAELFSKGSIGLIIDARGIVVLANRPEMQFQSLWPLSARVREELVASRQFGKGPFPAILAREPQNGEEDQIQGKQLVVDRQAFPWQDWALVTLTSMRPVTLARLVGIGVTLSLCLMLIGLSTIFGLNINAAARIQRSEKRYRELYETMQDGSIAVSLEGKITESNLAFQKMIGYSPEALGRLAYDEVTPEGWYPREAKIVEEQVLTRGYSDPYEKEFRRQDGSIFPVELQTYLVKDDSGNPAGLWSLIKDITVRKQALESLQKSEQNYRLLIKSLPSVVFKGYADGSRDFFDKKVEALTGYPFEDFITRRVQWLDLIWPEDRGRVEQDFEPAQDTVNQSYLREYRIKAKAGRVIWIRERGQIVRAAQGQMDYITGTCTDITKQHEMAATLESLRLQNELILNSAGEGLFGLDHLGLVTFVNPAALALTGFEADEVLGRNFHGLVHHKKADGTPYPEEECPINATLRHGIRHRAADDVFWTKAGDPIPVEYVTTAIEQAGQIMGAVGVFRDITLRKRREAEIKRAYQYLNNIFDNSAESIGIVDAQGLVIKWNKASEEIFGYTSEELTGQAANVLYADKDELANMVISLRREGYVRQYEITMRRKDGSTFPCSLSIRVLRDDDHNNIGSVTVARDLTEQKDREEKLHTTNARLQTLVDETDLRNRQMSLLQEMSDVFQACQTSGETYSAISHFVPQFFPDYAGALYILNNSANLYEMTATWGETAALELVFGNDECWCLRRTRIFLVADSRNTMNCRHVAGSLPGSYLCVPMMAQGEVMGIFHLCKASAASPEQIHAIGQFATAVAERMALALANLKLRETLRNQAIRDGLTGLYNRRYLEETLERELSRNKRQGTHLGVIMLDLDHFKEYNDTYGHHAGDELLCALGQLIQDQIRHEDIACRYGGEEFLLIIPGAPREIVLERAHELNLSVRGLHKQSPSLRAITVSAGVALFPAHGASGRELIKAADAALYQAKEAGRDRVVVACAEFEGLELAN